MRALAAFMAACALASCTTTPDGGAAPEWPSGIYSGISTSAETGDLGGLEVLFYMDGSRHMAEFVLCEGWCNQTYISEVTRDGAAFRFGNLEDGTPPGKLEYLVIPDGKSLRLQAWYNGEPQEWLGHHLKRERELFGIDIARRAQQTEAQE